MVVLIDGKTANGAEILVASLGDNKRAVLVGETTAGLVELQTLFPVGGGSYLRMRTALVSRPNGKRIDEHEIAPDREVVLTEEERAAHRATMHSFTTVGECKAYFEEHRAQMAERAKERGNEPGPGPR